MGMVVAAWTHDVSTELPRNVSPRRSKSARALENVAPEPESSAAFWRDVLREFRNHLSIVLARSSEMSTVLTAATTAQAGDCLADIEASAARMEGMLTWMDAGLAPGALALADLGEVLGRAVQLSATALRPHRSVLVEALDEARPAAIPNRGAAVESALAALFMELGRAPDRLAQPADAKHATTIHVVVEAHRAEAEIVISMTTPGATQLGPSSWRLSLARVLLASVGADFGLAAAGTGFEVRFPQR